MREMVLPSRTVLPREGLGFRFLYAGCEYQRNKLGDTFAFKQNYVDQSAEHPLTAEKVAHASYVASIPETDAAWHAIALGKESDRDAFSNGRRPFVRGEGLTR
jgi:hypothetical protein